MPFDLWIMFIFGIIVGLFASVLTILRLPTGTMRIDRHNPEKDLYRFDFDDLDILTKSKYLLIKIDTKTDLSHK